MVAAYLGVEPSHSKPATSIEDAAEYVPVTTVSASEFNYVLRSHGLPTGE